MSRARSARRRFDDGRGFDRDGRTATGRPTYGRPAAAPSRDRPARPLAVPAAIFAAGARGSEAGSPYRTLCAGRRADFGSDDVPRGRRRRPPLRTRGLRRCPSEARRLAARTPGSTFDGGATSATIDRLARFRDRLRGRSERAQHRANHLRSAVSTPAGATFCRADQGSFAIATRDGEPASVLWARRACPPFELLYARKKAHGAMRR